MAETMFEVRCVRSSSKLTFSRLIEGDSAPCDTFTVEVRLHGGYVDARVSVYDIFPARWSQLFADVAQNWRGWQGSKEETSLEGHLGLSFTADRLGHITMRVHLTDRDGESDWMAAQSIHIEAGQLDELASRAAAYFGQANQ